MTHRALRSRQRSLFAVASTGTAGEPSPITFEQVLKWDDAEAAFRLLYSSYLRKGLIKPNDSGLRFTHFNLLPETATFVAKAGEQVIATLTAIPESDRLGLPMDEIYGDELNRLRATGARLGEGSALAVTPEYRSIGVFLMMNLVKLAVAHAWNNSVTDVVIACHPKHARVYRKVFLFEEFGPHKTYRAVNDAPALALRLNIDNLTEVYRRASGLEGDGIYRFFFREEIVGHSRAAGGTKGLPRNVLRRLCDLQPSVIEALEARWPGAALVLTGIVPSRVRIRKEQGRPIEDWSSEPIFVAA